MGDCMYECMNVCMYVCMNVCTNVYMNVCMNVCMCVCIDLDECIYSMPCHNNGSCTNTEGSYECVCNSGYNGNGFNCSGNFIYL